MYSFKSWNDISWTYFFLLANIYDGNLDCNIERIYQIYPFTDGVIFVILIMFVKSSWTFSGSITSGDNSSGS